MFTIKEERINDLEFLKRSELGLQYPKETEIIILPGCNHGNGMYKQTKLYQSVIKEFIGRY